MSSLTAGGKQPTNRAQPTLKLAHLFDGLTVSRNFKLLFFVGMLVVWLYVIYWVRHHEPMLHEVMGRGIAAHTPAAAADRAIVNRVKGAFPVKTSQQMGDLYQPDVSETENSAVAATPQQYSQADRSTFQANQAYAYPSIGPGQAISAPSLEQAKFGRPRGYALSAHSSNNYNAAQPILTNSAPSSPSTQPAPTNFGNPVCTLNHYYVPIHSANGTYLKTIVNR